MSLTVLMLAAGRSRRFGAADKLMTGLAGRPLIAHAIAAQAGLAAERVAVVGPEGEAAGLLEAAGFALVVNPAPEEGQGGSLALGVKAAAEGCVLVMLGDMPFVTPTLLGRLLACGGRAVAWDGKRRSPPALFAATDRTILFRASGDAGARELLAGAEPVRAAAGELEDVDTLEALEAARRTFAHHLSASLPSSVSPLHPSASPRA